MAEENIKKIIDQLISDLKESNVANKNKDLVKANKDIIKFSDSLSMLMKTVEDSKIQKITTDTLQSTLSDFTATLTLLKKSSVSKKADLEKLERVSAGFKSIIDNLSNINNAKIKQSSIKKLAESIDILADQKELIQKLSTKRFAKGIENISSLMSSLEPLTKTIKIELAMNNIDRIAESISTIKEFDKLENSAKSLESLSNAMDKLTNPIKVRLAISSIKMLSKHLTEKDSPLVKLNEMAGANINTLSDNIDKLSNPIKVRLAIASIKMLSKHLTGENSPLIKLNEEANENIENLTNIIDKVSNPLKILMVITNLKVMGNQLAKSLKAFNKTLGDDVDSVENTLSLIDTFSNPVKIAGALIGIKLFGKAYEKLQKGVKATKSTPDIPQVGTKSEELNIDLATVRQEIGEVSREVMAIKFNQGLIMDRLDTPPKKVKEEKKKDEKGFLATIAGSLGTFLLTKFPFLKQLGLIKSMVTTLPSKILGKIATFLSKIPGVGSVMGAAKSVGGKALDFGKNLFGKAIGGAKSMGASAINLGKSAVSKVGKVVKALNPIDAIKKVLPKVTGLVKGSAGKILSKVPLLGGLITAVQGGMIANDVQAALASGRSPRTVALDTIPKAGGLIGQVIGGGLGTLLGPLGMIGGGLGGNYLGEQLASNFAPEIASALGFTESNDKKFFAKASLQKGIDTISPSVKLDSTLATTGGIPTVPEPQIKGVDELTQQTKELSEKSHSREAASIMGAEKVIQQQPIIIPQAGQQVPSTVNIAKDNTPIIPSSEDTNWANQIMQTRLFTSG